MFYYFAEMKDDTIKVLRKATEQEIKNLSGDMEVVSKMLADGKRIDLLTKAYSKIKETFEKMEESNTICNYDDFNLAIVGYLSSFKKYTDNWQTYLTRKYGKNSEQMMLLKSATNDEFDKHMEYRIIYRLRNYDQHCGNIISNIQKFADDNNQHAIKLLMKRDYLLENFHEWKQEEIDFLRAQPDLIEFLPIFEVFHRCILRIHEKVMQYHFTREFYQSCARIILVTNEFLETDNIMVLSNNTKSDKEFLSNTEGFSCKFTFLQKELCKKMLINHIIQNKNIVKIFFHGYKNIKYLNDIGTGMNDELAEKIANNEIIKFDKKSWIRTLMEIIPSKNKIYAVFVRLDLGMKEIECTEKDYKIYMEALIPKV